MATFNAKRVQSPRRDSIAGPSSAAKQQQQCGQCKRALHWLWNRGDVCTACSEEACRSCLSHSRVWGGRVCPSCTNLLAQHPSRAPSRPAIDTARVEQQVRTHVEALVAASLGTPLDDAPSQPDTRYASWRWAFERHHTPLANCLASFTTALRKAILNQPLCASELPTTRHSDLQLLLRHVLASTTTAAAASMAPTALQDGGKERSEDSKIGPEEFNSQCYEDLLATAVLNKVLEKCSPDRSPHLGEDGGLDNAHTDTDSGMSGSAQTPPRQEGDSATPPPRNTSLPPSSDSDCLGCPSPGRDCWVISPDQGVDVGPLTGSRETLLEAPHQEGTVWKPATSSGEDGPPVQFKIEEHIEEITTHHFPDDPGMSDSDRSVGHSSSDADEQRGPRASSKQNGSRSRGVGGSWHKERIQDQRAQTIILHGETLPSLLHLPPPNALAPRRVPFPELGADLLNYYISSDEEREGGSPSDRARPGDVLLDPDSWEENWLFRRQKVATALLSRQDPVAMLIPEAQEPVSATVGDRDIDELSELSERTSVSSSSELWGLSDSDADSCYDYTVQGGGEASQQMKELTEQIVDEFSRASSDDVTLMAASSQDNRIGQASRSNKRSSSRTYSKADSRSHSTNYAANSKVSSMFDNEKLANDSHDRLNSHALNGVSNDHRTHDKKYNSSTNNRNDTATAKSSTVSQHPHRKLAEETSVKRDESHNPNKLSSSKVRSSHDGSPITVASSKFRLAKDAPTPAAILLRFEDDVSILSPPSEVPLPSKDVSFRSATVWFTERPEETVVSAGRALRLVCSVNARGPVGVSWYHEGRLLRASRTVRGWRSGSCHHLDLFGGSEGSYAIAAYTATHCVWTFCHVRYKASSRAPRSPQMVTPLRPLTLDEGFSSEDSIPNQPSSNTTGGGLDPSPVCGLVLECQVSGHPEPVVCFRADGDELHHSPPACFIESDKYGTWLLRLRDGRARGTVFSATACNSYGHVTSSWDGSQLVAKQGASDGLQPQHQSASSGGGAGSRARSAEHGSKRAGGAGRPVTATSSSGGATVTQLQLHDDGADTSIFISEPKPGTIAEREHRKWQEAPPLPDNPYSAQRLTLRLASSASSLSHHNARDASDVETRNTNGVGGGPVTKNGGCRGGGGDEDDVSGDEDVRSSSKRDLTRYGRDYYVASAVPKRTPSWLNRARNGDQAGGNLTKTTETEEQCSFTLPEEKKYSHRKCLRSLSGGDGVRVPEALSDASSTSDWRLECTTSIQPAYVEREVSRLQQNINAAARYRPLSSRPHHGARNSRLHAGRRNMVYSSYEALNAGYCAAGGMWRTASVDEGLHSCPETTNDLPVSSRRHTTTVNFNNNYMNSSQYIQENNTNTSSTNIIIINKNHHHQGDDSAILSKSNSSSNIHGSVCSVVATPPPQPPSAGWPARTLERFASVDNFEQLGRPRAASFDGAPPHSMGCYGSDTNTADEAATNRPGCGLLSEGRRWHSTTTDLAPLQLPSVRQLASKFDSLREHVTSDTVTLLPASARAKLRTSHHRRGSKREESSSSTAVSGEDKLSIYSKPYRMKEVHSLTARSVPRYFREGLKNNRAKQPNRNILSGSFMTDCGGYDDTSANQRRDWDTSDKEASSCSSSNAGVYLTANGISDNGSGGNNFKSGSSNIYSSKYQQQRLPAIPQESTNYTPMESTYYNFTNRNNQESLPGFLSSSACSKDFFNEANSFTKHYQSSAVQPRSLSHLPTSCNGRRASPLILNSRLPTVLTPEGIQHGNSHRVTVTCNNNSAMDTYSSRKDSHPVHHHHQQQKHHHHFEDVQQLSYRTGGGSQVVPSNSSSSLGGSRSSTSSLPRSSLQSNVRDTSPDHLGIPGSRATLVPGYRSIPGDTSDESSTSTASPPRHSRRPVRTNSAVGPGAAPTRCR